MNTSKLEYLKEINTIVLAAGHGQGDPGATDHDSNESNDTVRMTNRIANNLKAKGLKIVVVPHSLGLVGGINWVNARYKNWNDCWNIEIHRDSANVANNDETSKRCGCYYAYQYPQNKAIADTIKNIFLREGASKHTWSRPDNVHYSTGLGWIQQTNGLASLLELGFIQGNSTNAHLDWLADLATKAIYEAFTGKKYTNPIIVPPPKKIKVEWTKDKLTRYFDANGIQIGAYSNNLIDKVRRLEDEIEELNKIDDEHVKAVATQIKELADELL